jgi:plastocyanin
MSMRTIAASVAALALGGAAAAVPTVAVSQSAGGTATAHDVYYQGGDGSNPAAITITAGSTVTISYPSGLNMHSAHFTPAALPSACTGTPGVVGPTASNSAAPSVMSPGWSDSCTFNTPGTYRFYCDRHGFFDPATGTVGGMSGMITVTGTGTQSTTTTTTTPPAPPGPTDAALRATAGSLAARSSQKGTAVAAKLTSAQAGLKVTVQLLLRGAHAEVLVGRTALTTTGAGSVSVRVALNASGRRSLRHRRHLRLTVKATVSASGLTARSASRTVSLSS